MSVNLVDGLHQTPYVYIPQHGLLAEDAWKESGPNIGSHGENLTISFLSRNRADLSLRLLTSIGHHLVGFAGHVHIIDNGSSPVDLARIRDACEAAPFRTQIIELGENFGVAGGRNKAIPHVTTDWVMSLDNDIYFTRNPLPEFQRDIATLGCNFINLPLLEPDGHTIFARGGHLYVGYEEDELHIGAGTACPQKEADDISGSPFLSTFLFGGASIFRKESFERTGAYDEAMFVGFEDIDFSIRLFRQGYKVGSSGAFALIHDHAHPASDRDRAYEKERYSKKLLEQSAKHLEQKYGFKVWSSIVASWLDTRHVEIGLTPSPTAQAPARTGPAPTKVKKPKIGLIIDTDGWAFSNIAQELKRHLCDRYEFTIIPKGIIDNITHLLTMTADCDLIHFFWREDVRLIGTPYHRSYVENLGMPYEVFEERFIHSKKVTTSVYDHLLLDSKELNERADIFNGVLAGYTVSSDKLFSIYSKIEGYPNPSAVVEDGVDRQRFLPQNLDRLDQFPGRDLIIGWIGNSAWNGQTEDFKGVHTILKPAIEKMKQEGFPIATCFADRQERMIPHSEMPDYYAQIDVCVCTSKIEGTPNPVLEAMSCGVPIITTDVGIVPQVFGPTQKRSILPERSVRALIDKIQELLMNPSQLRQMSQENLKMISGWDWKHKAAQFGAFFEEVLSHDPAAGAKKS